eukprot:2793416-Rhodomonas_salina.2
MRFAVLSYTLCGTGLVYAAMCCAFLPYRIPPRNTPCPALPYRIPLRNTPIRLAALPYPATHCPSTPTTYTSSLTPCVRAGREGEREREERFDVDVGEGEKERDMVVSAALAGAGTAVNAKRGVPRRGRSAERGGGGGGGGGGGREGGGAGAVKEKFSMLDAHLGIGVGGFAGTVLPAFVVLV